MEKVLVIQTAFLGDVILATALLEKIHKDFPGTKISMLVREGNESLLKDHPYLEEVLVWKKKSGKWRGLFQIIKTVRQRRYDAVFNLQRFFSSGLITAFSGAAVRAGFQKNPFSFLFTHVTQHIIGDHRHEADRNLSLLKGFGKEGSALPKLYPNEKDFLATAAYKNNRYVTMAPASVWFTKQLPENKWEEMIRNASTQLTIYLLGAPGDHELCERLAGTGSTSVINLAGKLSLLQSAALMRDAQMNYVNDSGPLHIASAMNAPVTAFFCSTVPAFGFGPLSQQTFIIETTEKLECRPCGLHGYHQCPLQHFRCATTIVVPVPGAA
ncbi:MAG: glycosyltransferase family 9 protein [Bacteroidota bacterium]|nr:glycosyltransferase family 9 protein [Bacteroidota bacterium]